VRQTLYLWGEILECLSPSPGRNRHRGNFCRSTPGRNLGFASHKPVNKFLPSPKAVPGVFAIRNWIGAWSGNLTLETRQSLASQVTSQIVGPEINVTFRYNPKKVRRAWGISQVIIDLILGWFLKNTQMQTRGSTELLFKNLLYDVHKEKVWRS
jgi:hypothetical protein